MPLGADRARSEYSFLLIILMLQHFKVDFFRILLSNFEISRLHLIGFPAIFLVKNKIEGYGNNKRIQKSKKVKVPARNSRRVRYQPKNILPLAAKNCNQYTLGTNTTQSAGPDL